MVVKPHASGPTGVASTPRQVPSREQVQAAMHRLARSHERSLKILEAYDKGEVARPSVRRPIEA